MSRCVLIQPRACRRSQLKPVSGLRQALSALSIVAAVATGHEAAAAEAARPGPAALIAVVSINDQRVTIWSGDSSIARSPVSTGMSGHRTPTGIFSVIGKEKYHESNLYSNAPMPFMQRITWSGVALHAGHLPGYPASHGCIRMPEDFAQRLFGLTRTGMRVIVSDRDVTPLAVEHPNLPVPSYISETQVANLIAPQRVAVSVGAMLPASLASVPLPLSGRMHLGAPTDGVDRLLNPMERGKIEQGVTKFAALEAEGDAAALLEIAFNWAAEAGVAADTVRSLDKATSALGAGRDKAIEVLADPALDDAQRARAQAAEASLAAALNAAGQRRVIAVAEAMRSEAAAFHAAAEAKAAIAERDALQDAARVAERATEPLTVFVSRKLHRVFVRQGFEPVFEADVEIADADAPLGTHVFTAVGAPSEGGGLRWVALTVPDTGAVAETAKTSVRNSGDTAGARPTARPVAAIGALERVKFSDDVLQKITAKLWTGASLIISDRGPSHETGKGTDFVVLTRSAD